MTDIKLGAIYKHYKGNLYRVLAIAMHSETLEEMVVYQALYGEEAIWVRPASMWLSIMPEINQYRFAEYIFEGEQAYPMCKCGKCYMQGSIEIQPSD